MAPAFSHFQESMHSAAVGDGFLLDLHVPDVAHAVPGLIYLDAHLPSGRKIPRWIREMQDAGTVPPMLLVGIGQIGSYFRKRNRDFIPQPLHKRARKSYGRADNFYRFLTTELIPQLEERHPLNGNWTLAGHSLGGLFVLYALLQSGQPFDKAISLSPSVWINRRNVLKLAERRRQEGHAISARLFMACGDLERFNFILPGMRAYENWLRDAEVPSKGLRVEALPWKTHFSVVKPGIKRGMEWLFDSFPT